MKPRPYQEYHFRLDLEDIGIAFNHDRVWVCLNGASLLRAKIMHGELFVEYTPPEQAPSSVMIHGEDT